tara:strand:+ start:2973 stop:3203 length:231 start_codon:yes stop_codon:yes gene_type:complete
MIVHGDEDNLSIPTERINLNRRNEALQETDWTQIGDVPLSESKKQQFQTYRQQLRDLTTHSNWPDLAEDDWPSPPS